MNYLQELSSIQKEAVTKTKGPLMIIAGAGSGKTRVLTYRIAHLLYKGISPFNILALTFTNKAAKEMKERIRKIAPNLAAQNLWMGTFHSIFARLLRYEAIKIGYSSDFTIYDSEDTKSIIKNIIKDLALNERYKPNQVYARISLAKNKLITWEGYLSDNLLLSEDESIGLSKIGEIYKRYAIYCRKANAMDFDDLLLNTNILLRNHLDVLAKYQNKFQYTLIDEFQDTNLAQYDIIKKISARNENICIVGDDAQSIYAFRGANIQNILNFQKDYPDTHIIKLEQNYRSTQNIVEAANSLIDHNQNQIRKKVWTHNPTGSAITLIKAINDTEEAKMIAHSIFENKMNYHLSNKDFAILYRTNAQSRALEEALRTINLPYKIIGGLSFYQRKEVKDALAYIKFTLNKKDIESLKRIINFPKRGIGNTSFNKIIVAADENKVDIWDILNDTKTYFSKRVSKTLDKFAILIKSFEIAINTQDAFSAAKTILKDSGLFSEYYNNGTSEGRMRYENLQELLNAIRNFTISDTEDKNLATFLQEAALMTNADQEQEEETITLMTTHMAKGLEFEYVYISGMEQNLFPSQMMLGNIEDLEEERRLFYVAITRAKTKLYLGFAIQRFRFGNFQYNQPSQFLNDIDPKFIENIDSPKLNSYSKNQSHKPKQIYTGTKLSNFKLLSSFKKVPKSENNIDIKENMTIYHKKFGSGIVKKLYTVNNQERVVIDFQNYGEKTLILAFAKLSI